MLSIKPRHLSRYKDLVRLLFKYGGTSLTGPDAFDSLDLDDKDAGAGTPAELAADLERLGPVFVKLGQLLSTRPDLLPPAYVEALSRLQDDVEPSSFPAIRNIVQEELGVSIEQAFRAFEERPHATASLGQVHLAELRDGRPVAVKVQRPGIREEAQQDMQALGEVAAFLERHSETARRFQFVRVLGQLGETLAAELDYEREARNMLRLREDMEPFEHLRVPAPVTDLCGSRVLVMEYVSGTAIRDLSPVVLNELDGNALANELFRAYLHQTLVNGFFHADPHPGNVLLDQERHIVLLDCGMMGFLAEEMRADLLKILLAIGDGHGSQVARTSLRMGEDLDDRADRAAFRRQVAALVAQNHGAQLSDIQAGRIFLELFRIAGENGILMPTQLTTLGKALLNLDEIGRTLDPAFDPKAAIRRHGKALMARFMREEAKPNNVFKTLLDGKELLEETPQRVNQILEMAANNELRLRVDSFDEHALLVGMQKISNRIASGIVLGSMIVGAGLMMGVETDFELFGYPGLAILVFLIGAVGSLAMLLQVLRSDRSPRQD